MKLRFILGFVLGFTLLSSSFTLSAEKNNPYEFESSNPIYIASEIKGSIEQLKNLLINNKMLSKDFKWLAGNSHLISLGNFIDGDKNIDTQINFFEKLKAAVELDGGKLHLLLGQYELELLSDNNQTISQQHKLWLAKLPLMIKVNQQVFTHGGLSNQLEANSLTDINSLDWKAKHHPTRHLANLMCHPYYESDNLKQSLKRLNSNRLWSGASVEGSHNHQVMTRLNNQLMVIGKVFSTEPSDKILLAVFRSNNDLTIYNINGTKRELIRQAPNRFKKNHYDMSEAEIIAFLQSATITSAKNTKHGRTKPFQVTLEKNAKQLKAVFKYFDSKPFTESKRWNDKSAYSDRYQYDIAAYRVDRMLNLNLVPITVEREYKGQKGVLVLWVDDLISELDINQQKLRLNKICNKSDEDNLLNTFDYLVRNTDRNQSNTLYNQHTGQIWFIDHTRAFSNKVHRQEFLRKKTITAPQGFIDAINKIERQQLNELRPWLHVKQVNALWQRMKRIKKQKI
jgi:hypothetical protein